MELSPTARVILGMIRMGKRTGYEIKQIVDVSTRFFWAASYGQIYPELKRLEERGLVGSRSEPTGGGAPAQDPPTPPGGRGPHDRARPPAPPAPPGPARAQAQPLLPE